MVASNALNEASTDLTTIAADGSILGRNVHRCSGLGDILPVDVVKPVGVEKLRNLLKVLIHMATLEQS